MSAVLALKTIIKDFAHILMPELCMACDTVLYSNESILCTGCLYHLPLTDFHIDVENKTAKQLWGKLDFEVAMSMLYLSKSSIVEQLLHQLKYENRPQIGVYLGKMYGRLIRDTTLNHQFDCIAPIPIHSKKLRERGYNQSYQFAKGLSVTLGLPVYENLLQRKVNSVSQIKKSRAERYANVEGVFQIGKEKVTLLDNHVLLVDDILTTGATVSEAGRLLKNAGAKVSVLTIARA